MDNATIDLQHAFYDMLMQSQYWSPERMRDYQRSQLTQLLRHAKKNVPFYENRLDAVMLPNGDIDWNRWSEIPIVKRSDLIEHREAMQARELPPGHGATGTAKSSGSTGQAVEVTINGLVVMGARANLWRSNTWQGLDWSKILCTRRHVGVPPLSVEPNGTRLGIWGPPWDAGARAGYCLDIGGETHPAEAVRFLSRGAAKYLSTGSKTIHVYAVEAQRQGLQVDLEACLAHGENVGEAERIAAKTVFGSSLFDLYSSKEAAQIAHPCEKNLGLHVNAESLLVEIVDEDGQACPAGIAGRVLVTPFVSTAQPLIRYDQGDIASWRSECACGRGLPALSSIIGRTSAIFRHPDGRAFHRFLPNEARALLDCNVWQIAQVGPTQFEIRYVPNDWDRIGDEGGAAQIFRQSFYDDAQVIFRRLPQLRATSADKHIEYVNETSGIIHA